MTGPDDELLDLGALARLLARGWTRVVGGIVAGVAVGALAYVLIPPLWQSRASVLTRRSDSSPFGMASEMAGGAATALLGKDASASLETDMALLRSRRLLSEVAERIPLGARVLEPRVPLSDVVTAWVPTGAFRPLDIVAAREGAGWRLTGTDVNVVATAGQATDVGMGALTVAPSAPDAFRLRLYDGDEMLRRAGKRITVDRDGGNIVGVAVRWDDSVTGSAVANALVERFVDWRRRTDAGENAARYDFVAAQADSVRDRVVAAIRELRRYQESSGQSDPALMGKALLETQQELSAQLLAVSLEAEALSALLARIERRDATARQIPAFPPFLESAAINELLTELTRLETSRTTLLATRTEADPTVQAQAQAIAQLEQQLAPMANTYAAALAADRATLQRTVDSVAAALTTLPGIGERNWVLSREVQVLNQTSLALEEQRVRLRLATITEGGSAQQLDVATATRKPVRPTKALCFGGGAGVGLLFGVGLALLGGVPTRRVRSTA
jgi:uncharacterized protein involved in exopolysaccharide biosynthesis